MGNNFIKESVKEEVKKSISEMRFDIDIEYCKKHGLHGYDKEYTVEEFEKVMDGVDLFDSKSNKAAFDLVFKNR